MTIIQLTNSLKRKYLYKQVFRFYQEQEETISKSTLREYYLRWRDENNIPYWCDNNRCNLHKKNPRWNSKKIILEVNHIDAACRNWRLKNLRLLCPNCHSQTHSI